MLIKKINAKSIRDSRGERTIQVIIKTSKGKFKTSAPAGASRGKHEVRQYLGSLDGDIGVVRNLDVEKINKLGLKRFNDLKKVEKIVGNKIGGNSLFALEASLLKAMAKEQGKELWDFLGGNNKRKIRSVGNSVGGGLHARGIEGKKPDFQEFLFIANGKTFAECVKINKLAYKIIGKLLKAKKRGDEGAWETNQSTEIILGLMSKIRQKMGRHKIDIGLDVAASSFYKNHKYYPENKKFSGPQTSKKQEVYVYKNPYQKMSKSEQIDYIHYLATNYDVLYVEDGLDENDFSGFAELRRKCKRSLIVGDDLTVTNPERLKKAIRMRSVNAVIVKPNQIGSLIIMKKVIDLCKQYKIKTIISHRSGETMDNTIADLGVGWNVDFIKTGIYGKVRESKLKRLIKIFR